MVWVMICQETLVSVIHVDLTSKCTTYQNFVADQVHPAMATVLPKDSGLFLSNKCWEKVWRTREKRWLEPQICNISIGSTIWRCAGQNIPTSFTFHNSRLWKSTSLFKHYVCLCFLWSTNSLFRKKLHTFFVGFAVELILSVLFLFASYFGIQQRNQSPFQHIFKAFLRMDCHVWRQLCSCGVDFVFLWMLALVLVLAVCSAA